jgi:tetratricopeptide (TPR) repeat protein
LSFQQAPRNRGASPAPPAAGRRVPGSRRDWLAAAALAAVTFAVFGPALRCQFVNFDDSVYAAANPRVQEGLSLHGFEWAFTTFELSNWHPLTWLSLQLDATLWRQSDGKAGPFGFHLTNVLLHAANAALLFLALRALTGAFWPSAVAALLFAVHPLRAESVAWIAERKDVLSVFFGLLALWAYADYVKRPSPWRYLAVFAAFAASLMSKPMLVTLPFLLLVLDWWPLGRVRTLADWRRPAVEKLPLLALTVALSVLTYRAQAEQGAVMGSGASPPAVRLANVAIGYLTYLAKTAWPSGLAVYYPYPKELRLPAASVAAALLVALTAGAVVLRRRAPYLLAGWLWYLGTLVPVIGIVQVGGQAYADRYSYFPQVGILIALCWGVAELTRKNQGAAVTAAAVAAVLLIAVTWSQLQFWHDSVALWERAVRVAEPSSTVLTNLGEAYTEQNNPREAEAAYRKALRLEPDSLVVLLNLGKLLVVQGKPAEAGELFRAACEAHPDSAPAHQGLAEFLLRQAKLDEAAREFEEVARLSPDPTDAYCKAYCRLGREELRRGDLARARQWLEKALSVRADCADAFAGLGAIHLRQGQAEEGLARMREAVRCEPNSARRHFDLGVVLERQNHLEESAESLCRAVELDPKSREYRSALNLVLNRLAGSGRADLARQIGERLRGL